MATTQIIRQLRERNFILCYLGSDYYGFLHRTFLEYFCAGAITDKFGKRGLADGFTVDKLITEVYGKHWQDKNWHETLRLIAGMIEPEFVGEIIEFLIEQPIDMEKFRDKHSGVEKEAFANLFLAADLLDEVGSDSKITETKHRLLELLMGTIKLGMTSSADAVFAKITQSYKRDITVLDWLQNLAVGNTHESVRRSAVQAIGDNYKENSNTLPWLQDRAINDPHESVRSSAVEAIGNNYKEDPNILPWLQDRAINDPNEYVRISAVEAIKSNYKENSNTLPWLQDRAINDLHESVRKEAVEAIGYNYEKDPNTLPWLLDRAINDLHESVRSSAVEAIGNWYEGYPNVLTALQDRAINDPHESVRKAAQEMVEKVIV